MMKPISVFSLYLLVIIILAGCGSGGGSTPTAANAVPSDGGAGSTSGTASAGEIASTSGIAPSGGAAVMLTWDPPTEPYAGIKVYYGTSPGNYTSTINAGMVSTYTVRGLASGTYYFALTAFDAAGNESDYSSVVTMTII